MKNCLCSLPLCDSLISPYLFSLLLQRDGNDLTHTASVLLVDALCGTTLQIPHLDGSTLELPLTDIVTPLSIKVMRCVRLCVRVYVCAVVCVWVCVSVCVCVCVFVCNILTLSKHRPSLWSSSFRASMS